MYRVRTHFNRDQPKHLQTTYGVCSSRDHRQWIGQATLLQNRKLTRELNTTPKAYVYRDRQLRTDVPHAHGQVITDNRRGYIQCSTIEAEREKVDQMKIHSKVTAKDT